MVERLKRPSIEIKRGLEGSKSAELIDVCDTMTQAPFDFDTATAALRALARKSPLYSEALQVLEAKRNGNGKASAPSG